MTYRFIAVHLKVTVSKTLVSKNRTFVGCQVLVPGTGLQGLGGLGGLGAVGPAGMPRGHQAGCWRGAKAVLVD